MSVELIAEVRDHAPADLPPTDRLTLVWIADAAQTEDRVLPDGRRIAARTCWLSADVLAARVGISRASLGRVLQRLRDRGLEVRVPLHIGADGRPVYAHAGRASTFRLPSLHPKGGPQSGLTQKGGPQSGLRADSRPGKGGPQSGPNRNEPIVNRKDSRSVAAGDPAPDLLPTNWQPNRAHRAVYDEHAVELHPRSLDDLAAEFARNADDNLVHRVDWDRAFSAYLRSHAAGRADVEFAELVDDPADYIAEAQQYAEQRDVHPPDNEAGDDDVAGRPATSPAGAEVFARVGALARQVDRYDPWAVTGE